MTLKEALETAMTERHYFCRKKEGRSIFADMIADIGGLDQLEQNIRTSKQIVVLLKKDKEVYRRTAQTIKALASSDEVVACFDDILGIVICSGMEWQVPDELKIDEEWEE